MKLNHISEQVQGLGADIANSLGTSHFTFDEINCHKTTETVVATVKTNALFNVSKSTLRILLTFLDAALNPNRLRDELKFTMIHALQLCMQISHIFFKVVDTDKEEYNPIELNREQVEMLVVLGKLAIKDKNQYVEKNKDKSKGNHIESEQEKVIELRLMLLEMQTWLLSSVILILDKDDISLEDMKDEHDLSAYETQMEEERT